MRVLSTLLRRRDGNIAVEFAFIASILGVLMLGVMDFGLAYTREMAMSNAVRAGTQFALARRPSIGPAAESAAALISLQNIRGAVVASADFLDSDPGTSALEVTVFCECDDGSSTNCVSTATTPLSCTVRLALLRVKLSLPYDMTFNFPGIGGQLSLEAEHIIRLT